MPPERPRAEVVVTEAAARPLSRRHPWVYRAAIGRLRGSPEPGDIVAVLSPQGHLLGQGYYNPRSQIAVRMLTFDERPIDEDFWRRRLERAIMARDRLTAITDARRLVHAESDGLPGLVVDDYAGFLVIQALTLGIEVRKGMLAELLEDLMRPRGIYERSDVPVRAREGLSPATGPLRGEAPPAKLPVREREARLFSNPIGGHKTGLYLDQRDNRLLVKEYAQGREVLDVCCYTGAFGLQAALGGARSVLFLETSARHLRWARDQLALNGLPRLTAGFIAGDAFQELRRLVKARRRFDLIVLDPPKFARSRGEVAGALRGYRDLNRLALLLLRPGGLLATFSCSGRVGWQELWQTLAIAALDARRELQIIRRLSQAEDHPVSVFYPEGEYLRGFLVRAW